MHRHMPWVGALSLAAFMSITSSASAQLALSANDGKAVLIDGVNSVPTNPSADSVAVIDLNATPPKVVAEIQAPASVVGPPLSVAVARDESFALVTGATKLDPADPKKTAPDDKLSVIDLKASPPKVSAQLQAGKGAAGARIKNSGTEEAGAHPAGGGGFGFLLSGKLVTPGREGESGPGQSGAGPVSTTP